jgi:3-oxoadipate enol-lactonase
MKVRANGIEIHCEVEGDGPWVVFSHALACHLGAWDAQAAALRDRYRILRFDTRGHGGTSVPPAPYTLDQLGDDLEGLLAALRVDRAHLVGISLGGMIAQVFALKHPQRLASLVLCDTTSRYPEGTEKIWQERIAAVRAQGMGPLVEPTLERWFTPAFRAARPDVMADIGAMIRSTSAEGYVGCGAVVPTIDTTDRLRMIDSPTLVVVGDQDAGTPPAMAQVIQRGIPGAQLQVIASASHLCNVEQPAAFNRALAEFLDRVAAPR